MVHCFAQLCSLHNQAGGTLPGIKPWASVVVGNNPAQRIHPQVTFSQWLIPKLRKTWQCLGWHPSATLKMHWLNIRTDDYASFMSWDMSDNNFLVKHTFLSVEKVLIHMVLRNKYPVQYPGCLLWLTQQTVNNHSYLYFGLLDMPVVKTGNCSLHCSFTCLWAVSGLIRWIESLIHCLFYPSICICDIFRLRTGL